MKKRLILIVLLMSVLSFGFSQTGGSWTVNNIATWIEAVGGIRSGGNDKTHIITVMSNISIPPTPSTENTFGSCEKITVIIEGTTTITVTSNNGNLLRVGKNQTVSVKNITLKGIDNNEGSVVIVTDGEFIMEGNALVTGNKKIRGSGGGVRIDDGIFTMKDNATVSNNSIGYCGFREGGGGVCIQGGTFLMQDDAIVSDNTAGGYGSNWGGVFVRNGTFTMKNNASIKNNNDSGVRFDTGTFIMQDNAIVKENSRTGVYISADGGIADVTMRDNTKVVGNYDGGVFVYGGLRSATFSMKDNTSISGNSSTKGGGINIGLNGSAILQGNATITSNTVGAITSRNNNNVHAYGGGVYIDYGGSFIMLDNTRVSGNSVISRRGSNAEGRNILRANGGGIYVEGGSFTMKGGTILGNTASTVTSSNSDDAASCGGGVHTEGRNSMLGGTFTMEDGTIQGNTAGNDGGGVYAHRPFIMQGGSITGNTAGRYGGGVFVDGNFTKSGGTIYGSDEASNQKNTATSKRGHAVYRSSGPQWRNVTTGPTMTSDAYGFWLNDEEVITSNSASARQSQPVQQPSQQNNFQATHKVVTDDGSNLRLRNNQGLNAAQIGLLENGSLVRVLNIGMAMVDSEGRRGNWTQIETSDGRTGWCFGAYLQPFNR